MNKCGKFNEKGNEYIIMDYRGGKAAEILVNVMQLGGKHQIIT